MRRKTMEQQNKMTDFSRQIDLLNPDSFTTPIHIIGCGATGSWVALQLAKLGIENVFLYDFDVVEIHNLPNQYFGLDDIGKNKAEALSARLAELTGITYQAYDKKVDSSSATMKGYVICLTDTMASRKDIWWDLIKFNPDVELYVETRMGLTGGHCYAIKPMDYELCEKYDATLNYDDDAAEVSSCGTSQSVAITAVLIANHVVWRLVAHHLNQFYPEKVTVGGQAGMSMTNQW